MTVRPLKGLAALNAAAVQTAPALHVLPIGDIPAVMLTVREVAESTRLPYDHILAAIHDGRLRSYQGSKSYAIPVSELAVIESWAVYQSSA